MERYDSRYELDRLQQSVKISHNIASSQITALRILVGAAEEPRYLEYQKSLNEAISYLRYFIAEKYYSIVPVYDTTSRDLVEENLNRLETDISSILDVNKNVSFFLGYFVDEKFGKVDREFCEYIMDMKGDIPYNFNEYLQTVIESTNNFSKSGIKLLDTAIRRNLNRLSRDLKMVDTPVKYSNGVFTSKDEKYDFGKDINYSNEMMFGNYSRLLNTIKESLKSLVSDLKELYKVKKEKDDSKDELGVVTKDLSIIDAINNMMMQKKNKSYNLRGI